MDKGIFGKVFFLTVNISLSLSLSLSLPHPLPLSLSPFSFLPQPFEDELLRSYAYIRNALGLGGEGGKREEGEREAVQLEYR